MSEIEEVWSDLSDLPTDPPRKRNVCQTCKRPESVCWCRALPICRLNPRGTVVLLQHPAEEKRCLRTAPMLQLALHPDKCLIFKGKRFPKRHEGLAELLQRPSTVLLYPSAHATELESVPPIEGCYHLLLIDGTWPQAKAIYNSSPALHSVRQVVLRPCGTSQYVIRTQPADGCLSTLETAARALAVIEANPVFQEKLLGPLHVLCEYQLAHGAVVHESKQLLIQEHRYPRQLGQRLLKLIQKSSASAAHGINTNNNQSDQDDVR